GRRPGDPHLAHGLAASCPPADRTAALAGAGGGRREPTPLRSGWGAGLVRADGLGPAPKALRAGGRRAPEPANRAAPAGSPARGGPLDEYLRPVGPDLVELLFLRGARQGARGALTVGD